MWLQEMAALVVAEAEAALTNMTLTDAQPKKSPELRGFFVACLQLQRRKGRVLQQLQQRLRVHAEQQG